MQTVYRFEIKPTYQQQMIMFQTLKLCRNLYNWALSERQRVYKETGQGLSYNKQQNLLPAYVKEHPEYKEVHSQVLQDVLRRLDYAHKRFFEKKAGYPRFKNRDHYNSFTYPQVDTVRKTFAKSGYIYLSKIGFVKMIVHREFEPQKVSRANVKYHGGKWYANLTAEISAPPAVGGVNSNGKSVGIDVGLEYFAVLSDGTFIETSKHYRKAERKLAKLQRRLSRKKKGSNNRGKAKKEVAKLHAKVANQRKDFLHKASLTIVKNYDIIVMEDLRIKNMAKNRHLAKSIHDAGWGQFGGYIRYKAERHGKVHVKVNPNSTSQECLCGAHVPKDLSIRIHRCPVCGLVEPRDLVSAKLIERMGLSLLAA
ncbi:transposase [Pelotomaculum terephthalicicum JT]|uniref:RNA-guided endonuclease InsQ/TnpB family protein n=1 Tax=Pelotomaculum terephthalicicum TaxID=206393 RepID=UPI001F0330EA|nr:transposase [Pelotomaculum terephthalicicum]MCG9966651.1 transposase [Pelotomaculum terephthalicicum JT]